MKSLIAINGILLALPMIAMANDRPPEQYPEQIPRAKCGLGTTSFNFRIPVYGEQNILKHTYSVDCSATVSDRWAEKKRDGRQVMMGSYTYELAGACRVTDSAKEASGVLLSFGTKGDASQNNLVQSYSKTLDSGFAAVPRFNITASFAGQPRPGAMLIRIDGGAPFVAQQNVILQSVECAGQQK